MTGAQGDRSLDAQTFAGPNILCLYMSFLLFHLLSTYWLKFLLLRQCKVTGILADVVRYSPLGVFSLHRKILID